ncbi:MAG TPA: MraY family glycosyltransferase [Phycisphaerales bacterium]|nr:MraY family glycosyltransferase [Phycisphaerales bacterium]HMP38284.1 MraY family glycosyltransferase [Phycisphaerales bacterium]
MLPGAAPGALLGALLAGVPELDASEVSFGPARLLEIVNSYTVLFVAAFLATLLATPLVRVVAVKLNIIDHPDRHRKHHDYPVAYLGGVAVFIGVAVAIATSYVWFDSTTARYDPVPLAVVVGMVVIAVTGLADDVLKLDPRLKIMGQLVAAAALAIQDIGVRVAAGVLGPLAPYLDPVLGTSRLSWTLPVDVPLLGDQVDLIYWAGTLLIAMAVLGACNATNLIDGLDGLLSGVVAIMATGLIAVSVLMAMVPFEGEAGEFTGARLVLGFALLGAVLGFLPHNFNPASIFLGDCGSLLLGYLCIVVILMFGEHGQTHLVFAGLIIFALPIMDTVLAIIRRVLAGVSLSAADDQHIHHQLKRTLGTVRKAVFALYGIAGLFTILGVTLAALVLISDLRVRVIYAIAIVIFGFIAAVGVKSARREQIRRAVERAVRAGEPA